jgi:hypothetical protein
VPTMGRWSGRPPLRVSRAGGGCKASRALCRALPWPNEPPLPPHVNWIEFCSCKRPFGTNACWSTHCTAGSDAPWARFGKFLRGRFQGVNRPASPRRRPPRSRQVTTIKGVTELGTHDPTGGPHASVGGDDAGVRALETRDAAGRPCAELNLSEAPAEDVLLATLCATMKLKPFARGGVEPDERAARNGLKRAFAARLLGEAREHDRVKITVRASGLHPVPAAIPHYHDGVARSKAIFNAEIRT